jgi:hypothetical protein
VADERQTSWTTINCLLEVGPDDCGEVLPVIFNAFFSRASQVDENLRYLPLEKKQLAVANLYDRVPGFVALIPSDMHLKKGSVSYRAAKFTGLKGKLVHTQIPAAGIHQIINSEYKKRDCYAEKIGDRA